MSSPAEIALRFDLLDVFRVADALRVAARWERGRAAEARPGTSAARSVAELLDEAADQAEQLAEVYGETH